MTAQWSREQNNRLIQLFLENEYLWDSELERKTDCIELNAHQCEAYKRIAEELNIKPQDVKDKITNIKNAYKREKNTVLRMQENGKHYKPGLYYFDRLDEHLSEYYNTYSRTHFGILSVKRKRKQIESKIQKGKQPKKKIYRTGIEKATQTVTISYEEMPKLIPISKTKKTFQETEFKLFGKSLAKELKELPLEHALKLHLELQNIITDHRVSMIKKKEALLHSIPGPSGLSNKNVPTIGVDGKSTCDSATSKNFMPKTEKNIYHPTMNNAIHNEFDEFDANKDVSIKVMISEPCESDDDT